MMRLPTILISLLIAGAVVPVAALAAAHVPVDADAEFELELAFDRAVEERDRGDLGRAIAAFSELLAKYPKLHRARLELAVARFLALDFAGARRDAETVLADPSTPAAVRPQVEAFLQQLDAASRPSKFTPFVSLSLLIDSNVNGGPDNPVFSLPGGGSGTLTPSATERSDTGAVLYGGLQHRYLTGRKFATQGGDASLVWLSRATLYHADYFNEDDRDLTILAATTGPTVLVPRRWRAALNGVVNLIEVDGDTFARYLGLNPSLTWYFPQRRLDVTVDGLVQDRDFKGASGFGRDNVRLAASAQVRHVYPGDRISTSASVTLFDEDAGDERWSRGGWNLGIGASYRVSKAVNLFASGFFEWVEHDGNEPTFGVARDERLSRLTGGISYTLSQGLLTGWTVEGSLTRTSNDANISIFDYDRTQLMTTLRRSF